MDVATCEGDEAPSKTLHWRWGPAGIERERDPRGAAVKRGMVMVCFTGRNRINTRGKNILTLPYIFHVPINILSLSISSGGSPKSLLHTIFLRLNASKSWNDLENGLIVLRLRFRCPFPPAAVPAVGSPFAFTVSPATA